MSRTLPIALLLAALSAGAASATTVSPKTALQDFNAVIFTNASTTSDIEGAAVIGGNFSGATVYTDPATGKLSGYGALTVFGSTSGNPINLDDGGSAYVGGSKGATLNFNGGGSYIAAPTSDIANFQSTFTALSQSLAGLSANDTLPTTGNNELISATHTSNGVAVFDITAAQLSSIPSYQIALDGAKSIIFNVSGSTVNFNANDESGVTGASDIIWNFYQAKTVTLGTQIAGTVLAPLANVTNDNHIDGTLVANSWSGNGELHDYTYQGNLPANCISAAPEPSTWALLLLGIGGIGLILRRARKTTAIRPTDAVTA